MRPPAALCLDACSQPRTFSCFQISASPAPRPLPARSRPCLLLAGSRRGLPAAFQPGGKLPPPWMLRAATPQHSCSWAGFSPNSWLGDSMQESVRMEKVSRCSPDASLCASRWRERGKRVKITAVSSLKKAVSKDQSGERGLLPLSESGQDWRCWALNAHARSSVENLAPYVFWIDTGFRDLENKSCWRVGAVGSLGKYPE